MKSLVLVTVLFNWAIVPITARQCYFCFSDYRTERDDCVKVVDSTRAIFCDSHVDECVVYLRRDKATHNQTGEIVRDCLVDSSLLVPGEYQTCSGDKCNYFNFPRDRLLCQQCENCEQIQREPEACRLYYKYHSACVTYIDLFTNRITRGCQTNPDDTFCDDGNTKCVYCMYDDCNRDPRERQVSLRCYHCDIKDVDCYAVQDHTAIVKNNFAVPLGEVFYCWTIFAGVNNGIIFRFHEFHKDFNDYFDKFCGKERQTPSPQCARCFGNLCNTHFRNGRCYECLEDNPDCDSRGRKLTPINCEKNYLDNYGCYGLLMSEEAKTQVRRGCITDLDYLHQKSCIESPSCFFCRGDYCNKQSNVCYQCTQMIPSTTTPTRNTRDLHGNGTEVNCLNASDEGWPVEYCGSGDSCFLHISSNGGSMLVERGCMSGNLLLHPAQELLEPGLFQLCGSSYCNDWESLNDTHSCYNLEDVATECTNKTNHCYTAYFVTAAGVESFEKGCYYPLSKFSIGQLACDKHIDTCTICAGELCNHQKIRVQMTRKCLVCNDRRSCMYFDAGRGLTRCVGEKYYWQHETCYYGLDTVSRNITRGCTMMDFVGRKTPPSNLLYCPTDGCNYRSVNDYQCYQCDSNSPNAAPGYCFVVKGEKDEILQRPSACVGEAILQEQERGCYTYYTPTRILKRGCIRHLTAVTIAYCETNQTHCKMCFDEECNDKNINGGPREVVGGLSLLIILVCIFDI